MSQRDANAGRQYGAVVGVEWKEANDAGQSEILTSGRLGVGVLLCIWVVLRHGMKVAGEMFEIGVRKKTCNVEKMISLT